MTHTTDLKAWESRLVQHLVGKPLFKKQTYDLKDTVGLFRTIDLPLWQARTAAWIRWGA